VYTEDRSLLHLSRIDQRRLRLRAGDRGSTWTTPCSVQYLCRRPSFLRLPRSLRLSRPSLATVDQERRLRGSPRQARSRVRTSSDHCLRPYSIPIRLPSSNDLPRERGRTASRDQEIDLRSPDTPTRPAPIPISRQPQDATRLSATNSSDTASPTTPSSLLSARDRDASPLRLGARTPESPSGAKTSAAAFRSAGRSEAAVRDFLRLALQTKLTTRFIGQALVAQAKEMPQPKVAVTQRGVVGQVAAVGYAQGVYSAEPQDYEREEYYPQQALEAPVRPAMNGRNGAFLRLSCTPYPRPRPTDAQHNTTRYRSAPGAAFSFRRRRRTWTET